MIEKINAYVRKYHMLSQGDTVAAGVSGGADSVCLLFVLMELRKRIPFELLIVHVNHLIREEAGADAAYVKALCSRHNLPYYLIEKDVAAMAKEYSLSLEEAGRQARYAAFEEVLHTHAQEAVLAGKARIAVAHNSNDRAETMLFHLFRGTGLAGLCGIRPVRSSIIRPLLCTERAEIEQYLRERHIDWCTDYTNEEDIYTRNKIRHHILPFAEEEITKGAVRHMGKTADMLLEVEDFVQQSVQSAYNQCRVRKHIEPEDLPGAEAGSGHPHYDFDKGRQSENEIRLNISQAKGLHPFLLRQMILYCIEKLTPARRNITSIHVRDIESLFTSEGNRYICLPYDICVAREYGEVLFTRGKKPEEAGTEEVYLVEDVPKQGMSIDIPGLGILDFQVILAEKTENIPQKKYTKWFDYDKIKKSPLVRKRCEGDFLTINEALSHKSLKDYMIAEKISRQERDKIWVFADGRHIIWVIGYRISEEFKVSQNTKHILKVQVRGGQE